jgi:hypothetical protein
MLKFRENKTEIEKVQLLKSESRRVQKKFANIFQKFKKMCKMKNVFFFFVLWKTDVVLQVTVIYVFIINLENFRFKQETDRLKSLHCRATKICYGKIVI